MPGLRIFEATQKLPSSRCPTSHYCGEQPCCGQAPRRGWLGLKVGELTEQACMSPLAKSQDFSCPSKASMPAGLGLMLASMPLQPPATTLPSKALKAHASLQAASEQLCEHVDKVSEFSRHIRSFPGQVNSTPLMTGARAAPPLARRAWLGLQVCVLVSQPSMSMPAKSWQLSAIAEASMACGAHTGMGGSSGRTALQLSVPPCQPPLSMHARSHQFWGRMEASLDRGPHFATRHV